MEHPRNPPRARHKRAAWLAEQARRERCGLSNELINATIQSRSLSLRAASFREAVPQSTSFELKVKQPKLNASERKLNALVLAAAAAGENDIVRLILHA